MRQSSRKARSRIAAQRTMRGCACVIFVSQLSQPLWPRCNRRMPPGPSTGRSSAARAAPAWRTRRRCRSNWSTTDQRRLEHRRARPRLVVADRLARSRVRHVRGQPRHVQGAIDRHLRQRLRRGAAKQGLSDEEIVKKRRQSRHRADERYRRDQLRVYGARREDRQGDVAAGSAQGPSRSAAGTARTRTRRRRRSPTASGSTPRSAATSACSVIRSTASCCGSERGRRSRSTSTSVPRRRPSCTTAASISCTTTTAKAFLAALDAKTGARNCGTSRGSTRRR